MTRRTRRSMLALLPASLATGCAWILYPERRWQKNPGRIEVVPLVVDCLLFIPGIVPGIIALSVDFGTRSIYVPRHQARRVVPGDVLPLDTDVPEPLEMRVFDVHGQERARERLSLDPNADRQQLGLTLPSDEPYDLCLAVDKRVVASATLTAPET